MYNQVYDNLVLYKKRPTPRHTYRQIVIVESQHFEVRIYEGDVVQSDPKFDATSSDAEVYFHSDLQSARDDPQKEFDASVEAGWIPYP